MRFLSLWYIISQRPYFLILSLQSLGFQHMNFGGGGGGHKHSEHSSLSWLFFISDTDNSLLFLKFIFNYFLHLSHILSLPWKSLLTYQTYNYLPSDSEVGNHCGCVSLIVLYSTHSILRAKSFISWNVLVTGSVDILSGELIQLLIPIVPVNTTIKMSYIKTNPIIRLN